MKIELEDGQLVDRSIREVIFAKAIEMIVGELTQERLKEFALEWLDNALKYGFNSYEAQKPLQKHAEEYLKTYAMQPENLRRVEEAVRLGFERIIEELPGQIFEKHKDRVLEAFNPERRR